MGAWGAALAPAQTVELSGRRGFDREVRSRIEEVLGRGRYRVWTRDTLLAAGDTLDGDVFLFRASARVEGAVAGRIVGVESEVFVRPGAEVRGGVVVLNGGYYGTQLAKVGPVVHLPIASYRVRAAADGSVYRIVGPRPESGFALLGVSGLLLPAYERVSALAVPWGFEVRPPSPAWPYVRGVVRYRTGRERAEGDLRLAWSAGALAITLAGGRTTATQDGWISGEAENSLASFGFAADHRNYYDAKFVRGALELRHGFNARFLHAVAVEWEEASSLGNEDPFSLFETEGGFRPNPPVARGRLVGLRLASEVAVAAGRWGLAGRVFWEAADASVAGEFTYARAGGEVTWEGPTFAGHTLRVQGRGGGPLAGRVPEQRWVALGGYKTLPTFDALSLRGDTHLFVRSTYFVPLLSTGLGRVQGWAQHALGSAWVGAAPPLEHNLGLGLDLGPFAVWLFADPAAADLDLTPGFGLRQF